MLEATQSFCQESESLSEEATQAFAAPEEEETERVPQPDCEEGGGGVLEERTAAALSVSPSRGQQDTSLSTTEPSSLGSSSSELASHAGTEGGADPREKEEETEPAHSAQIPSDVASEPSSALQEVPGNLRSEAPVSAGPPEAGSTAGGPQSGSGEGEPEGRLGGGRTWFSRNMMDAPLRCCSPQNQSRFSSWSIRLGPGRPKSSPPFIVG